MESTTTTVLAPSPIATPAVTHPTECPSWCKDRTRPVDHHFGPSSTAHWSPQLVLPNPSPLPGTSEVLLRAELCRIDAGDRLGGQVLYVSGESDIEVTGAKADALIAQMQSFVDRLRLLRGQMGR